MNNTSQSVEILYYSYQPIVNIHTGVTFGFEALLRGWESAGYDSIQDVFDQADRDGSLGELNSMLYSKAVEKLNRREDLKQTKLFYNLDNRLFMTEKKTEYLKGFEHGDNDKVNRVCFEISEKHEFPCYRTTNKLLAKYREQEFRIAVDDFGSGYSGLTLLYHSDPDYIKIDRFFIENINEDSRKKFFVANVVNLAHMMNISVIAEGIETIGEFYVCREIGCDYVQGYLIQRPESRLSELKINYRIVQDLVDKQARRAEGDSDFIKREIVRQEAVRQGTSAEEILEMFRNDSTVRSFPVVNHADEPVGMLREADLKKYVYSPYGIAILRHKSSNEGIDSLIAKSPVMEITNPIENFLDLFSLNLDHENVIITENGRYRGVLGSAAILRILSEKKISIAQDQNPLTKLPGNTSINSYLGELLRKSMFSHILVYFDLDNFKPFNDVYGFRQGDRIIRLFSEILQEHRRISAEFIGHIGGDDFFTGFNLRDYDEAEVIDEIHEIIKRFSTDVTAFYKDEHRRQGYITAKSRSGRRKDYPLLSVSAAVICLENRQSVPSMEYLSEKIAALKVAAKKSDNHAAVHKL